MCIRDRYKEVDDLHWQVEIYDYIYDSEGNHITADDVVFSFNELVESGNAFKYASFESVKKIDDYTVEFTWTAPIDSVGALEWPLSLIHIFPPRFYHCCHRAKWRRKKHSGFSACRSL